jgi:hypothetical protein
MMDPVSYLVEQLPSGALPVYQTSSAVCPLWVASELGPMEMVPSSSTLLPVVRIEGTSKSSAKDQFSRIMEELVLCAGFSGHAYVALRTEYAMNVNGSALFILELSVMFTRDLDAPENYSIPVGHSWIPESISALEENKDKLTGWPPCTTS